MAQWYAYEGGQSRGREGFEGGIILRDEEYGDPDDAEDADARLTLEETEDERPYLLTATVYGWMAHTHALPAEEQAQAAFETMKPELARLADMIPDEEDAAAETKARLLLEAVADFERRFP